MSATPIDDTPEPSTDPSGPEDEQAPRSRATEHYLDEKHPRTASGHTWGAAVTSIVGPTDETRDAVDPDQDRTDEWHGTQQDIQDVIAAVAETHGGQDHDVVQSALQRGLEATGHWPQPEPWFKAVTSQLAAGADYRMGTDTEASDTTGPDRR